MINWKDLRLNPPAEECNICVKIGENYETYRFMVFTEKSWGLYKYPKTITMNAVPLCAKYIILDDIL